MNLRNIPYFSNLKNSIVPNTISRSILLTITDNSLSCAFLFYWPIFSMRTFITMIKNISDQHYWIHIHYLTTHKSQLHS